DCKEGPEMGILALAEEILTSNSHIKLPKLGRVEYERAEASEKDMYFLPEVTVFTDDTEFYIDIVLDKNDSSRAKSYLEGQHNSIEIDLSEYVYTSRKEFKKALLDIQSNKRIIYWNDESKE